MDRIIEDGLPSKMGAKVYVYDKCTELPLSNYEVYDIINREADFFPTGELGSDLVYFLNECPYNSSGSLFIMSYDKDELPPSMLKWFYWLHSYFGSRTIIVCPQQSQIIFTAKEGFFPYDYLSGLYDSLRALQHEPGDLLVCDFLVSICQKFRYLRDLHDKDFSLYDFIISICQLLRRLEYLPDTDSFPCDTLNSICQKLDHLQNLLDKDFPSELLDQCTKFVDYPNENTSLIRDADGYFYISYRKTA
jgi:hypothetical protein